MSKIVKLAQAMRERALKEIEKNSSAARVPDAADASPSPRAGSVPAPAPSAAVPPKPARREAKPVDRGGYCPDVFTDVAVCRFLGVNKAYLVRARKSHARGGDWDAVEHRCGMTAAWVLKQNPAADLARLLPDRILPGGGIATVEAVQHSMDYRKLVCKRLSDGAIVVVQVNDSSLFRLGDQFDAEELSGSYRWNAALNRI